MDGENLIYWNGRAVGIDMGGWISWFANAPREAIDHFSTGLRHEH